MGVLDHSVWIHAQPEDVWSVYVDPARIPEWQTGSPVIIDIRGAGDEPGATYVSRRGPVAARTTVLEAETPHRQVTRTEAYLGLRFDVVSQLRPDGDGTRLNLRVETHWPRGLGLFGRIVEFAILNPREASKELANLRALVEREATTDRDDSTA